MKRIPKQEYTAAFKEQAVAMVKSGKLVPEVARSVGAGRKMTR
jgi:transposase-like protein